MGDKKPIHDMVVGGTAMTSVIAALWDHGLADTGSKIRHELIIAGANGDDGNPVFHAQEIHP